MRCSMIIITNSLYSISQSPNLRMGLSSAKVSQALFLERYTSHCFIRLKEVCEIEKGKSITEEDTKPGTVPVIAGGKSMAYYHNTSNRAGNVITISASGASSGFVNYWDEPIWASDCITVRSKNEDLFLTKFIYYLLNAIQSDIYLLQKGSDQPHVYPDDIKYIKIPDIPIEVQKEVLANIQEKEKRTKELQQNLQDIQAIIDVVFEREFSFAYDRFNDLKSNKIFTSNYVMFANNPDLRFSVKFHREARNFVMKQLVGITDKKSSIFCLSQLYLAPVYSLMTIQMRAIITIFQWLPLKTGASIPTEPV